MFTENIKETNYIYIHINMYVCDTCVCIRTLMYLCMCKGTMHTNFRVVVNLVEEECGVRCSWNILSYFFFKKRVTGCKYNGFSGESMDIDHVLFSAFLYTWNLLMNIYWVPYFMLGNFPKWRAKYKRVNGERNQTLAHTWKHLVGSVFGLLGSSTV